MTRKASSCQHFSLLTIVPGSGIIGIDGIYAVFEKKCLECRSTLGHPALRKIK